MKGDLNMKVFINEHHKRNSACFIHLWEGNDCIKVCKNIFEAKDYCNKNNLIVVAHYWL